MTWIGGMLTFVVAVMPFFRGRDDALRTAFVHEFGRRFRRVEWICVAVLAVTGTFNLWARGVRFDDFLRAEWRQSSFGRLVLIKLGLVLVAVTISALHEHVTARWQARWLGRLVMILGLLIVAAAVLMVRAI